MRNQKKVIEIIILGSPLLISSVFNYMMNIADTIMVSHLGLAELSGIAIAESYYVIFMFALWPILLVTQGQISTELGAFAGYDKQIIGKIFNTCFISSLIICTITILSTYIFQPMLFYIIKNRITYVNAMLYISLIRWSLIPLALEFIMTGFLVSLKKTKVIMFVKISINILNIFFNYILIFGKFGITALGIKGAASGTLLARWIGVIILIVYLILDNKMHLFTSFFRNKISLKEVQIILSKIIPLSIQNSSAYIIFLIYRFMIERTGENYLGATHIVMSLLKIIKSIIGGFSRSASIFISQALGEGIPKKAEDYVIACLKISFSIGFTICLISVLFPEPILRLFTDDSTVISAGIYAIYFFAFFYLIEALGYSLEIILGSNNRGAYVLTSELISNSLFTLLCTFIFVYVMKFNIFFAWLSYGLYLVCHTSILGYSFISKKWTKLAYCR